VTDESAPSTETGILSPEDARRIASDAASRYFESRRSRVDAFVDRHFSLVGSAAIHRKAFGWDMLKAPANIVLAVPQLATKLAAAGAEAVRAERASACLGSRKLMFDTAVGQEIEWLIITDLLELPFRQGEQESPGVATEPSRTRPGATSAEIEVAALVGLQHASEIEAPISSLLLGEIMRRLPFLSATL
jgi:hypothetical protein